MLKFKGFNKFGVLIFNVIVLTLVFSPVFGEEKGKEEDKEKKGKIEDMTIISEDKFKTKSEKPYMDLNYDVKSVIIPTIDGEEEFLKKTPSTTGISQTFPKKSNCKWVASFHLNNIVRDPVVSFPIKVSGANYKKWELIVIDSAGGLVKQFEGGGNPPLSVKWDGKDKNDKIIKTGTIYSYLIKLTDETEKVKTIAGKPFAIDGMMYPEKDKTIISLDRKKIFEKNKEKMIKGSEIYLKEICGILKEFHKSRINIEVYGENIPLSTEQAKALTKYFITLLHLSPEYVETAGFEEVAGNNRINIVIKK